MGYLFAVRLMAESWSTKGIKIAILLLLEILENAMKSSFLAQFRKDTAY